MTTHRIPKTILALLLVAFVATGIRWAEAGNNAADLAYEMAKQLDVPAKTPGAALIALQGHGVIPQETNSGDRVTKKMAREIAEGLLKAGISPEDTARILTSSASSANVPPGVIQGAVKTSAPAKGGPPAPAPKPAGQVVAQATPQPGGPRQKNVADLSLKLAKELGIEAADGQSAWKALVDKKIIPEEVFFTDPVTANVAQVIAIGLIKTGISPGKMATTLTAAAAAAAVPLREAVQGIVLAAVEAGVNVEEAAKAASEGAVKGAASQVAHMKTKGEYVERFFINEDTRFPKAAAYLPKGKADYAAVAAQLAAKGENLLEGTKPGDTLTRLDFLTLSYLIEGGPPGTSFGEKKLFLKKKGLVQPSDIGLIRSFQGDATLLHAGAKEGKKITGSEAVLFKDVGETELDAKIEIQFDDGSILTISEDTALTIDEMVYDPKTKFRSIKLRLKSGTIHIKTAKNDNPKSRFSITTPTVVAGLRGTDVYVNVAASGNSNVIANPGADAGNVVMRSVTQADRAPLPATPPPGPPPVLPATPADATPAITVTPGNASSAAVGQATPAPPAPPAPDVVAAATAATTITNPTPLQPQSVAGAAAGAAAKDAASGTIVAVQAAGADIGPAVKAATAGAVTAAGTAGAEVAIVASLATNGAVGGALDAGADVAAVATAAAGGVVAAGAAIGVNVDNLASAAGNGAILAAQARALAGNGAVLLAQAVGGGVADVATAFANGAVAEAQARGLNVASVAGGTSRGLVLAAAISGANTADIARATTAAIITTAAAVGVPTAGAVKTSRAPGADAAMVATATTNGAVEGAQDAGAGFALVSAAGAAIRAYVGVASAAGNGAVLVAQAGGEDVAAAGNGAVLVAQAVGGGVADVATAFANGAVAEAQARGLNVASVAAGTSRGLVLAATFSGANTADIARATTAAIITTAAAVGVPDIGSIVSATAKAVVDGAAGGGGLSQAVIAAVGTGVTQGATDAGLSGDVLVALQTASDDGLKIGIVIALAGTGGGVGGGPPVIVALGTPGPPIVPPPVIIPIVLPPIKPPGLDQLGNPQCPPSVDPQVCLDLIAQGVDAADLPLAAVASPFTP